MSEDIKKIPPVFLDGRPVISAKVTHSVGGGEASVTLSTGSEGFNKPTWKAPVEGKEIPITWGGRPLYKGYVGVVTRNSSSGNARLEIQMKPLINKLSEKGAIATSIVRGADVVRDKGVTNPQSPRIYEVVGYYQDKDNMAEWLLKVADFLSDNEASSLVIPGKAYPKYKVAANLPMEVLKSCINRDTLRDTSLSFLVSFMNTTALSFVSKPSLEGKYLLAPTMPMIKNPKVTISPKDYLQISESTKGPIFPKINICVPKYAGDQSTAAGQEAKSSIQAFRSGEDLSNHFHVYPNMGEGLAWYTERPAMFGFLTSMYTVKDETLGDAAARVAWGTLAYGGRNLSITIPWNKYWDFSNYVGDIMAVNLPHGFGEEGPVYGMVQAITLDIRRSSGEQGSSAYAIITLVHVRGEEENEEAFEEHPFYGQETHPDFKPKKDKDNPTPRPAPKTQTPRPAPKTQIQPFWA